MLLRTAAILLLSSAMFMAAEGRYEQYTAQVASGFKPTIRTLTSGRWGGAASEQAFAGAFQADGSALVAVGWAGGAVPAGGRVVGDDAGPAGDAVKVPRPADRSMSGGILRLAADGSKIQPWIRFGRGTGVPTAIRILGDTVIVAGCGQRSALTELAVARDLPGAGGSPEEGAWDATFVIGLSQDGSQIRWVLVGPGGSVPDLEPWKDGVLLVGRPGIVPIDSKGVPGAALPVPGPGQTRWLAANQAGVLAAFGDVNTHTNKEPYRNPFLHLFDAKGTRTAAWYSFDPKKLGSDTSSRSESDSSPRAVAWAPDGDLFFGGWSDGGNSVFLFQPTAFAAKHECYAKGFVSSAWGMGVGGLGHIQWVDPRTSTVKAATYWVTFVPNDPETFKGIRDIGRPNTLVITSLNLLGDGAVVAGGDAATGLIETPDAWWRYPGKGKMGGEVLSVFTEDLSHLRFSTYMPTVEDHVVVTNGRRILVLGRSIQKPGKEGLPPPEIKPLQTGFGGGGGDAFIALLETVP